MALERSKRGGRRIVTEGIVVRRIPFGETSEVLSWFTPDHGIQSTLAKGIHRRTSPFKGCFDLLDHCEIAYSPRRRGEALPILASAVPKGRLRALREASDRFAAAYSMTEIVREFVHVEEEYPELFTSFRRGLELVAAGGRVGLVVAWFRARCLSLSGHRPELGQCVSCGSDELEQARFDLLDGGMTCRRCLRHTRGAPRRLGSPAREILVQLLDTADPDRLLAGLSPPGAAVAHEIRAFLREVTSHVLERELRTDRTRRRRG